MKKVVQVDMDDTIAHFLGSKKFKDGFNVMYMYEPGFFRELPVVPGALVAVRAIMRLGYDVQILTQPLAESPHSYSEKVEWIALHFPDLINKINMTQDKGLFKGGTYLIDDNAIKWKDKWEANGGIFIHFPNPVKQDVPVDLEKQWMDIVKFFEEESKKDAGTNI